MIEDYLSKNWMLAEVNEHSKSPRMFSMTPPGLKRGQQ